MIAEEDADIDTDLPGTCTCIYNMYVHVYTICKYMYMQYVYSVVYVLFT